MFKSKSVVIKQSSTNRSSVSVDNYLREIGKHKYDPLTPTTEAELSKKYKETGCEESLSKMVNANVRFVVSVAKTYDIFDDILLIDLINEGNIGLVKACRSFDYTRGFKIITHAVAAIRQHIYEFINREGRLMRLPYNKIQGLMHIDKVEQALMQTLGRKPTIDEVEIAFRNSEKANKYAIKDFDMFSKIKHKPMSLEKSINGEEDMKLSSVIKSDNQTDEDTTGDDLSKDLKRCLANLSEMEREIIISSFGLNGKRPQSIFEISQREEINVVSERVRQIRHNALRKLQSNEKAKDILLKYLG